MKEAIDYLISNYEEKITNVEWHISVNSNDLSYDDVAYLNARIRHFREFINNLKSLPL